MRPDPAPLTIDAPLSPGEVHYLWWFIQGSIMNPEVRRCLWRAWGMCPRHGVGALAAEAAFRHGYLHGPAILYADLMERAARAFRLSGPLAGARLAHRLRSHGPCLMCEMGLGPDSPGFVSGPRLSTRRDLGPLRRFAGSVERYWRGMVCGRCARTKGAARCRGHLVQDLERNPAPELARHRALVAWIARHTERFSASFRLDLSGTDTPEGRAALVSAVGWCSGWKVLLGLL